MDSINLYHSVGGELWHGEQLPRLPKHSYKDVMTETVIAKE